MARFDPWHVIFSAFEGVGRGIPDQLRSGVRHKFPCHSTLFDGQPSRVCSTAQESMARFDPWHVIFSAFEGVGWGIPDQLRSGVRHKFPCHSTLFDGQRSRVCSTAQESMARFDPWHVIFSALKGSGWGIPAQVPMPQHSF
jgi:hypothetical protein